MIQVEYQDDVVIAKLAHNITNAIDLEVVNKLDDILKKVKNDPDVHSFILSSSNEKFFSIGFNIPQLFTLPKADFEIFYKALAGWFVLGSVCGFGIGRGSGLHP